MQSRPALRPRARIVDYEEGVNAIDRTARAFRTAVRTALGFLDDIATNDNASMGMDDIDDLCAAREVLAKALGTSYNTKTERYR